jgi:hypothetical protein
MIAFRAFQGNEGVVDMFCRILISVDEDLVSLDIPRSVTLFAPFFALSLFALSIKGWQY